MYFLNNTPFLAACFQLFLEHFYFILSRVRNSLTVLSTRRIQLETPYKSKLLERQQCNSLLRFVSSVVRTISTQIYFNCHLGINDAMAHGSGTTALLLNFSSTVEPFL